MDDIPYPHIALIRKWHRNYVLAVQLFIYDTAAHSISIQTYEQIEQCSSVPDSYILLSLRRREYFLREVKRIVFTLLK